MGNKNCLGEGIPMVTETGMDWDNNVVTESDNQNGTDCNGSKQVLYPSMVEDQASERPDTTMEVDETKVNQSLPSQPGDLPSQPGDDSFTRSNLEKTYEHEHEHPHEQHAEKTNKKTTDGSFKCSNSSNPALDPNCRQDEQYGTSDIAVDIVNDGITETTRTDMQEHSPAQALGPAQANMKQCKTSGPGKVNEAVNQHEDETHHTLESSMHTGSNLGKQLQHESKTSSNPCAQSNQYDDFNQRSLYHNNDQLSGENDLDPTNNSSLKTQATIQQLRSLEASKQMLYDVVEKNVAMIEVVENRESKINKSKINLEKSELKLPSQKDKSIDDIYAITEAELSCLKLQLMAAPKEVKENVISELIEKIVLWLSYRAENGVDIWDCDYFMVDVLALLLSCQPKRNREKIQNSESDGKEIDENSVNSALTLFMGAKHEQKDQDDQFRKDVTKTATFTKFRSGKEFFTGARRAISLQKELENPLSYYMDTDDLL